MKKLKQWEQLEQQVQLEIEKHKEILNLINVENFHQDYTDYFTYRDILSIYRKLLYLHEQYHYLMELKSTNSELLQNELLNQTMNSLVNQGIDLSLLLLTIMKLTEMEYHNSPSEKLVYLEFHEFVWKLISMYQGREECSVIVVNILNQYLERLTPSEYGLLKVQQYTKNYDKNSEIALQPLRILGGRYLALESRYLLIYETVLEMLQSESDQLSIDEVLQLFSEIYGTDFYKQNIEQFQKKKI